MINDPTILKVEFHEDQAEEFTPKALMEISTALEAVCDSMGAIIGGVQTKLFLVATPQRGSIIFLFRPQIVIKENTVNLIEKEHNPKKRNYFPHVIGAATIAGTLWTIAFGENGILDFYNKHSSPIIAAPRAEEFSTHALANAQVRSNLKNLISIAAKSGAKRITIKLPDQEEVIVFDETIRKTKGLIGRNVKGAPNIKGQIFSRTGGDIIQVRYRDRDFKAFLSKDSSNPRLPGASVVILWGSLREIPNIGQSFEAKATVVGDPFEIEPQEPTPVDFESVPALLVLQTSEWR